MGDEGAMYVAKDILPAYQSMLRDADMILPNAFEAEILSGVRITDVRSMVEAISVLHKQYLVPHVVITSVRFKDHGGESMSVFGSSIGEGELISVPRCCRAVAEHHRSNTTHLPDQL
ncbi:hypothetical protein MRB53_036879 [Persea americana]|nr:hypothetical protein MRB53_036879 [Persea americana]